MYVGKARGLFEILGSIFYASESLIKKRLVIMLNYPIVSLSSEPIDVENG